MTCDGTLPLGFENYSEGFDLGPFLLDELEVMRMLETTMKKYREDLLKQGEQLGEERGRKLGEELGEAKGLRTSITLLFANRFGDGDPSFKEWLSTISDVNRLQRILLRVSTAPRIEDIREDLD